MHDGSRVGTVTAVGRLIGWSAASRARTLLLVFVSLAATGAIDYATGYRYAFSPLYLFPVLLASSALGRLAGMVVALTAALVWTFAQQPLDAQVFLCRIIAWNTTMRFAMLGFIAWLLTDWSRRCWPRATII